VRSNTSFERTRARSSAKLLPRQPRRSAQPLGVMDRFVLPDEVARHAGLTMMQAASIASVLGAQELICPFAVVAKGSDRQSVEFESETQDEAVSKGWASLDEWKGQIDLWAFAREGLVATSEGKVDVLVVAAWGPLMSEPALFTQRFLPNTKGGFALIGPIEIQDLPQAELDRVAEAFSAGIAEHPKAGRWFEWKRG
jgi:hypothetical protein